jgi:hypothetical protein
MITTHNKIFYLIQISNTITILLINPTVINHNIIKSINPSIHILTFKEINI